MIIHSHLYNAFHNYLGGMLLLIVQGKSDFIITNYNNHSCTSFNLQGSMLPFHL